MVRGFVQAGLAALALLMISGCGESHRAKGDYASLVNGSGTTGMKGNGSFASGANAHPGYNELPIEVGSRGAWAPATGNHPPITWSSEGTRGLGIANDSGGIGIGIH
jgi:hypothetical protein